VDGCSKATFKRGYCADHYRSTYGDGASSSSSKAGAASLFSAATVGCEDMIMLSNASEKTITENLQVRHAKNLIYTYIGHGQQTARARCACSNFVRG
jgi:myosin heavy subunit